MIYGNMSNIMVAFIPAIGSFDGFGPFWTMNSPRRNDDFFWRLELKNYSNFVFFSSLSPAAPVLLCWVLPSWNRHSRFVASKHRTIWIKGTHWAQWFAVSWPLIRKSSLSMNDCRPPQHASISLNCQTTQKSGLILINYSWNIFIFIDQFYCKSCAMQSMRRLALNWVD